MILYSIIFGKNRKKIKQINYQLSKHFPNVYLRRKSKDLNMTFFLQTLIFWKAPCTIFGKLPMQSTSGITLRLFQVSILTLCNEDLHQNRFADVRKATTEATPTTRKDTGGVFWRMVVCIRTLTYVYICFTNF